MEDGGKGAFWGGRVDDEGPHGRERVERKRLFWWVGFGTVVLLVHLERERRERKRVVGERD